MLHALHPDMVVRWHREGFRLYWTWKSRRQRVGRPPVDKEIRKLIRQMQSENIGWGAPRIHGELLKLGIDISQATVSKYMVRHRKPPSQTWRTFLENHSDCIAGIDFFTVPTATFRVLYVFIVLSHDRRHIVHFNVTAHPTAPWTAQQLVEAFPFDSAPRYLLRDRDAIYGEKVRRRIKSLGIEEVVTAPRSPWQNPFVERIIGSIRRDCLNQIIVLNERHLRRILREYFSYYHTCRTHLSLNKDPPETRTVEPPAMGNVVAFPHVGGLHHRYGRIAA
jgi:putative transposase